MIEKKKNKQKIEKMEEKNINAVASAITHTIKGIPYKGVLPKVGGGWGNSVGSDFYGGKIVEVAEDLSWLKTDRNGYAAFDHRKNSIHCGRYVFAYPKEKGKGFRFQKTIHAVRCTGMNVCHIYEGEQKDRLDLSF